YNRLAVMIARHEYIRKLDLTNSFDRLSNFDIRPIIRHIPHIENEIHLKRVQYTFHEVIAEKIVMKIPDQEDTQRRIQLPQRFELVGSAHENTEIGRETFHLFAELRCTQQRLIDQPNGPRCCRNDAVKTGFFEGTGIEGGDAPPQDDG